MPTAAVCLRASPHYQREAYLAGISRLGYRTQLDPDPSPRPDDVMVTWNRHGRFNPAAEAYERAGARVIVTENGYIGADDNGHQLFAMALDHHNGPGHWRIGYDYRWARLRIELQPWRKTGTHILVMPSRSIGPPGVAMPVGWTEDVVRRIGQHTDRPIRVRPHPGKDRALWPIDPDLVDCWAVVIWASGAGIKALVAGVPVFYELEGWIGAPAARFGARDFELPYLGPREPMLHRLSYAQWTIAEIEAGEPFRWLLA